jgi:hypothetical protein
MLFDAEMDYSLILFDAEMDLSTTKMCIETSTLTSSNMNWRFTS